MNASSLKPLNLGCAYGVRFSPDGARLAVLGNDLTLWDVAARQKLWRGKPVPHCSAMAFSPDGSRLAVKSTTGLMAVLDAATGDVIVNFRNKKDGEGSGPAWSPCGQYIVDGSWDGRLQVRAAATGELVFAQDHPGEMLRSAYAIDAIDGAKRLLVLHGVKSVEDGQVQPPDYVTAWDWPLQAGAGRTVLLLPALQTVAASPGGQQLAALHRADGADQLSVFALADGKLLATTTVEQGGGIAKLTWLPDGRHLARIGKGKLQFYGWPGLALARELAFTYPCAVAFLPQSPLAAIGSWEKGALIELNLNQEPQ
ncbi:WD40 repeat domain-containing protein [Janthinobacterium psychrotolerans]|uniref:WD40-like Beta Propeller Repeat n=1 Tax=Janthinobacterium psychrotolerans TaxID=1747903 RepID=A0A1A7BTG1_9BURK|nr:hypothetical protein [Janthinobacterium psychrotolerans]OBV36797.1 hypothetical protein ASR47_1001271 [Janthinobacterium psychrotolerans]